MAENDYDAFAAAYDADNEVNAWNAYYERPAILALVGDVAGLSVLDAGCGGKDLHLPLCGLRPVARSSISRQREDLRTRELSSHSPRWASFNGQT